MTDPEASIFQLSALVTGVVSLAPRDDHSSFGKRLLLTSLEVLGFRFSGEEALGASWPLADAAGTASAFGAQLPPGRCDSFESDV